MAKNNKDVAIAFKAAMALDDKVETAKKALEAAILERSDAVKKVYEANGNDSGPFSYKGRLVTIRHRQQRDDEGNVIADGKETWFFVAIGGDQLMNIE